MNGAKVRSFLERLAVRDKVSASTQNQALNALVMFFREGLSKELGELGEFVPAKRPKRIPVGLTREEVRRVLNCMNGDERLMARFDSCFCTSQSYSSSVITGLAWARNMES